MTIIGLDDSVVTMSWLRLKHTVQLYFKQAAEALDFMVAQKGIY